ncbi:MAG: hypothetical protein FJ090_12825, partial [Deltaproteobacteria bacterium]|nr:hypothetical protein [Deltaproteobacteria bacterium]
CAADSTCSSGSGTEACLDGNDNDGDGLVDCDDPDCAADSSCTGSGTPTEACLDGADNDADGLVDCDDPDCASDPSC